MTVEEIYKRGISFLPEVPNDNPDLKQYAIPWINTALQECLEIENSIRRFYGEEELEEAPVVTSYADEVIYHDGLTRVAFPYFVASNAFIDDDNDYRANIYRTLYQTRANEAMKYTKEIIKDVY